ncbi:MAG TPA: hypothetical protein VGI81_01510 [Tepidisphaeraceae bacterium]
MCSQQIRGGDGTRCDARDRVRPVGLSRRWLAPRRTGYRRMGDPAESGGLGV